jgi:hypothetical protein
MTRAANGVRWALLLLVAGVTSAAASFEIRPSDPVGSPLLPLSLPCRLWSDSPSIGDGPARWEISALHLSPFSLAEVPFDAVSARGRLGSTDVLGCLSRLSAPGYAEWGLSGHARLSGGFEGGLEILRTQPDDVLRATWGVPSRHACVAELGWARFSTNRLKAGLWLRDLCLTSQGRRLGLSPRLGGRMEFRATPAWRCIITQDWPGAQGGEGVFRAAVAWTPVQIFEIGQGWARHPEGESGWLVASAGPLRAQFWSTQVGQGLPVSTGFCLTARGTRSTRSVRSVQPDSLPAQGRDRPAFGPRDGLPSLWLTEPERLESAVGLDAEVLTEDSPADSFGAASDSLGEEERIPVCPAAIGSNGAGSGATPDSGLAPVSLDQIDVEDLVRRSGLTPEQAMRLVAFLQERGVRRLRDLTAVPQELEGPLREAVPYLTEPVPILAPASRGSFLQPPFSRSSLSYLRTSKARADRTPRTSNQIEYRRATGRCLFLARARGVEGSAPGGESNRAQVRGVALVRTPWVTGLAGRGGNPLTWGLGLLGRAQGTWLRSTVGARGGESAGWSPSSLLGPSTAGTESMWGLESREGRSGLRALAARNGERKCVALCWDEPTSTMGSLLRLERQRPPAFSLWVSRRGDREEAAAEWADLDRQVARGALRWARARTGPGPFALLWWNLELGQRFLLQETAPAATAATSDRTDCFRRRLRVGWQNAWVSGASDLDWSLRQDVVPVSSGRSESRQFHLRGWGNLPVRVRWDLRLDGSRRMSRPAPRDPDDLTEPHNQRTRRWRVRGLCASLPVEARHSRSHLSWCAEGGRQREDVGSAAGMMSARASAWFGLARTGSLMRRGAWSMGILQVENTKKAVLDLAPSWTGGSRALLHGSGLWVAGRLQGSLGPLGLSARALWPCAIPRSGTTPAVGYWELSISNQWKRAEKESGTTLHP